MSRERPVTDSPRPDRLYARMAAILLGAAFVMALGAQLVADRVGQQRARAAELGGLGIRQSQLAHQIADALAGLGTAPLGPERRMASTAITWEFARLHALEARRRELERADASVVAADAQATLLRDAAELLQVEAPDLSPATAARLATLFAAELAPQYDRLAPALAASAKRAERQARTIGWLLLALEALGLAAVAWVVVWPGFLRIRAWVAQTDAAERESRFRMLHDPLTGLPNASYLQAHMAHVAAKATRDRTVAAVLRLDLDRFVPLRSTIGARSADEIIRMTARRVRRCLRAGDFAAYLSEDNFVVVATDLADGQAATALGQRLQSTLKEPFATRAGVQRLTCSIGVALVTEQPASPERILGNAQIALAEAQALGLGSIRYFSEEMRDQVEAREGFFAELSGGLERGEIMPFFQPQVDLATGAFSGFEALARWHHPQRGLLAPAEFLDFADQVALTERIGEAILAKSLGALRAWDAAGFHVPKVGVNFSLGQLRDPCLIEKIKWEVERFGIEPERVAIEVLETVLIKSDTDMVVRNLRGLASAGFEIDLDDFGTGHASISNLRRFMVERIKIDRSFIEGIEKSDDQHKLTASMVAMARALGIRTLAEGVETEAGRGLLHALGCDEVQGYLIARPMSFADASAWLASYQPRETGSEATDPPA